jgi:predicted amidophosphoribosyltransferase
VCDETGTELSENVNIIDFDVEGEGVCPVCGEETRQLKRGTVCRACGYDESKDNALECAVKLANEVTK